MQKSDIHIKVAFVQYEWTFQNIQFGVESRVGSNGTKFSAAACEENINEQREFYNRRLVGMFETRVSPPTYDLLYFKIQQNLFCEDIYICNDFWSGEY